MIKTALLPLFTISTQYNSMYMRGINVAVGKLPLLDKLNNFRSGKGSIVPLDYGKYLASLMGKLSYSHDTSCIHTV